MRDRQLKVYLETRPLVKADKKVIFDRCFEYAVKNNKFEEFQKIAYAIKLMSKGINITAFKPMFADKPRALRFAEELVQTQELVNKGEKNDIYRQSRWPKNSFGNIATIS